MSAVDYLGLDKTGPAHVGYDDLDWKDIGDGWERTEVELASGDSAWNPTSTKNVIWGPAKVTYERGPSLSVTALVE